MRQLPKKPKGRGKRWLKGHSCSSNPETTKFREAAKSRFFRHEVIGRNVLTVGALKTLDAFNNRTYGYNTPSKGEVFDGESTIDSWISSNTFKTFASDWSNCSNISFSRLLDKFEPKSLHHKEMLAVLAAVTEIIKANGGKETSTEYFGALITTLEATKAEETIAATLSLLSMGIKSVPHEVLILKFSETSKILLNLLAAYSETENSAILRAVLGCLSVILRVQDPSTWSYPSTLDVFHSILIFSTHSKPRIRKAGQHAVCAILKASVKFTIEEIHPAAATAAKYCNELIEKSSVLGGNTLTLHILTLLKEIISCFSKGYIKVTCETLLKLMTLGTPIVTSSSLEVLHNLFTSANTSHLDSLLIAKVINALYDYQPSINDPQATVAWLTVMQEGYKALSRRDTSLCLENLEKFFVIATNLWLSDKSYILKGCTTSLRALVIDCLHNCRNSFRYSQVCQNIFSIVENCLKYQFNNSWTHVFTVLSVLFEVIGKNGETYMANTIKILGELRESHNFSYGRELDYTVGKAVRFLGPEIILKSIPLIITGAKSNHDFKMSWLLPILKENIQSSSLKFFIDYFLPMASVCERRSKELNSINNKVEAHSYDLLQLQIWSLLPTFCNGSSDFKEHFKKIAKILGDLIAGRKQIRIHIMASLRKLITRNQGSSFIENLNELAKFSKNYLPILFNLYLTKPVGTDECGERLAAYNTIEVYLSITSPEQCQSFYDRALEQINEVDRNDTFTKESLMDLLKLLIPYQNDDRLSITYDLCIKALKKATSKKEEKKFYRLLEVIISSKSENCKKITKEKKEEILAFLIKSIKNSKTSNRGARLRCIYHIVKIFPMDDAVAIRALIPEAVICCKDINKNTRLFAFRLLEEMFSLDRKSTNKFDQHAIRNNLSIIIGGLAGTSTLASATILALSKLTHALNQEMPPDIIQSILESVCLLNNSPQREIVASALSYIKIFLTSFPKNQVLPFLPTLVNSLISMNPDCKSHFRLKIRDILDRLIKKFGFDHIYSLVPAEDFILQKRLKNLKKINLRKKQKKAVEKGDTEENLMQEFTVSAASKSIEEILASTDESEGETEVDHYTKKSKDTPNVFIQEDAENIMDFVSPSSSLKVSGVVPTAKKLKRKDSMKFAEDGRILVTEPGKNKSIEEEDSSDIEKISTTLDSVLIGRKRKLGSPSEILCKYQAGGSGIYRVIRQKAFPTNQKLKQISRRKETNKNYLQNLKTGKEYQAKKAKGDIKLKGKPDPYAYIPLSRKLLNRRQKINKLVKFAIRGAKIGAKLKINNKKKQLNN